MNASNSPEHVDQVLAELEQALSDVDTENLDSVFMVLEHLTRLNDLLGDQKVPPEKFQSTRLSVDRALVSINALLTHLVHQRDQVGDAIAKLPPTFGRRDRLGTPQQVLGSRRLDVSS
ncbi:MAG: hypothetical protein V2A76_14375 [Planctomycetota bacterium]